MPQLREGLLEKGGYWEPAKPQIKAPPLHKRVSNWVIDFIKPELLTASNGKDAPVRRTAYLDGLRGFAAFMVYWHHHSLWAHNTSLAIFENGYGYEGFRYFVQLPIIRMFFTGGHFAVAIFFVISGYVLSVKPLSLIQSGDYLKLGDNIGSALFRRWLRLHIPLIVTTFLFANFAHAVWKPAVPELQSNWRDEMWWWYCEMKNFTFVFRAGGEPWLSYNFHSWSIPVEFRGSILVYTVAMAYSRCTRNARLLGYIVLFIYFMFIVDGWYGASFISGMLLADLDLLARDDNLPGFFRYFEPFKQYIWYGMFISSLLIGGIPSPTADVAPLYKTPIWKYVAWMKPQAAWDYKWFFLFWAGMFAVASIQRIPWARRFFETRFCQYLGRVSFALYLVHGPVLWTLGERLYAAVGFNRETNASVCPEWVNIWPLPKTGVVGLELAFIAPQIILLPVTMWLAEMVTKLVDEPSVKVSQWLYQRTLAPAIKL